MKYLLILLLLVITTTPFAQEKKTVVVPPSKDTTIVEFVANTVTSSQTTVSATTRTVATKPVDTIVVPPPTGGYPGYTLFYSNNYEKGTTLSSSQCGRCNINTTTPITGTGSFEAYYVKGDASISSGYRSEQQMSGSESPTDKGIIIEWDQRFDILPSATIGLSMQWHGTQDGTSGNGSMQISGGEFVFMINKTGVKYSSNTYSPSLGKITIGKVYHIKVEIKFTNKSTGYVRVFIDNILKWNYSGVVCDGKGQYFKPGINLYNNANTVKTSIDNLRIYHEQ